MQTFHRVKKQRVKKTILFENLFAKLTKLKIIIVPLHKGAVI